MSASHWQAYEVPPQRLEAWHGDRLVRCFVDRPATLSAMLRDAVARHPQREALIFGEQRWTYEQAWQVVQRHAAVWAAQGIEAGDRVVLFLSNRPEFWFQLFALQWLGAIAVPVGVREQKAGLSFILQQCQARAVVFDGELAERIPTPHELPSLPLRLSVDAVVGGAGMLNLPELLPGTDFTPPPAREREPADVAVILYTSGTTGQPKGAMLTQRNLAHSVRHFEVGMRLSELDRAALAVPGSHVTGLVAIIATMVHVGGATLVLPEFKAADFLQRMERERISYGLMVPAMYSLCLLDASLPSRDLSAWRVGGYGGAPMPVAVIDQLAQRLPGLTLVNAYGATETTSPATMMPEGFTREHADTVGVPLPCADMRVMDDDGVELPAGQVGEIWIGGPMVVPGYWDNPQATAQSFTAGYWHSGDLGSIDELGFVRVFDRKKDMLNRGGFKIYSVEVENCLMGLPGIQEAAIVGRPCPVLGERVHAFIYAPSDHPDTEAVRAHCRALLADYKVPETLTWLDAPLPRNANGKVLKRQLRERLTTA